MSTCGNWSCRCPHIDCHTGWIDVERQETIHVGEERVKTLAWKVEVAPCPVCDPERAAIVKGARSREEMGDKLRHRSRNVARAEYDADARKATRAL